MWFVNVFRKLLDACCKEEHNVVKSIKAMPKATYAKRHHRFISATCFTWRKKSHIHIILQPYVHLIIPFVKNSSRWCHYLTLKPKDSNNFVPFVLLMVLYCLHPIVSKPTCTNCTSRCTERWIVKGPFNIECHPIEAHLPEERMACKFVIPTIVYWIIRSRNHKDSHESCTTQKPFQARQYWTWDIFILVFALNPCDVVSVLKEYTQSCCLAEESIASDLKNWWTLEYHFEALVFCKFIWVCSTVSVIPGKSL